ncbi:Ornithine aminotransferase [Streptomyces violarus]
MRGYPEITAAMTVTGGADALLHVRARDVEHFEEVLERIRRAVHPQDDRVMVLAGVRELTRRKGCLFVADEIQSGLGRTGSTLAVDESVVPDVVLLGKALGGGIVPVSAVVGRREVLGVLHPGEHGSTFGGNPLAAAVGTAVVELLETGDFQRRATELGAILRDGLTGLVGKGVVGFRSRGWGRASTSTPRSARAARSASASCGRESWPRTPRLHDPPGPTAHHHGRGARGGARVAGEGVAVRGAALRRRPPWRGLMAGRRLAERRGRRSPDGRAMTEAARQGARPEAPDGGAGCPRPPGMKAGSWMCLGGGGVGGRQAGGGLSEVARQRPKPPRPAAQAAPTCGRVKIEARGGRPLSATERSAVGEHEEYGVARQRFDVADAAPLLLDPQGVVTGWTGEAGRLLAYPAAEAVGRKLADLLTAEDAQRMPDLVERCRRDGGWTGLLTARCRDGSP